MTIKASNPKSLAENLVNFLKGNFGSVNHEGKSKSIITSSSLPFISDISLSEIISSTKYRFLSHFSELFKIDCNSLLSTSYFLSLFLMT